MEVSGVVCRTQRTGRHDILFYELVSGLAGCLSGLNYWGVSCYAPSCIV